MSIFEAVQPPLRDESRSHSHCHTFDFFGANRKHREPPLDGRSYGGPEADQTVPEASIEGKTRLHTFLSQAQG